MLFKFIKFRNQYKNKILNKNEDNNNIEKYKLKINNENNKNENRNNIEKEIKDEDDENIIDTSKEKLKFLNNNKLVSNSVNNNYNKNLNASLIKQKDEDKSIIFKDKLIKISKIPIFKTANYMDDKIVHSDSIKPQ